MNVERKKRLQIFLTIMDTIHDFGDDGRYDDPSSYRHDNVKTKVLQSLMEHFTEACFEEIRILGHTNINYKKVKELYSSFYYKDMNIPRDYQQKVKNIVFDILQTFYDVHVEIVKQKDITNQHLYNTVRSFYKSKYIKYILDKNRSDNKLFCVEPKLVKRLTSSTLSTSSYMLKTILIGKFTEYDNQRIMKQVTPFKNISSFFHIEDEVANNVTYEYPCMLSKVLFDYDISREANELLFFDKVGVSKNDIYHMIADKKYMIELRYFSKHDSTGLPLFMKAFVTNERKTTINELEKVTLTTVAKVFKISSNWFDTTNVSKQIKQDVAMLSPYDYVHALYDLKRAMDYLQVKACVSANEQCLFDDTTNVYVSSDRLAVLYAMVNNCPAILTRHDTNINDVVLEVYNLVDKNIQTQQQVAGMMKVLTSHPEKTHTENEYHAKDDLILFTDIIKEKDKSYFQAFLRKYRDLSAGKTHMSFVWYITYKTVFYFLMNT